MIKLVDILKEIEINPLDRLKQELQTMATSWDKSGKKGVAKLILTNINNMTNISDAISYLETLKYSSKEHAKAIYVAGLLKRYK